MSTERQLCHQIAEWLQYRHPSIIYRFDLAADVRLTIGQARRHKTLHPVRGYSDLFIAAPRSGYNGLFLELKADHRSPYLKNGQLSKNKHVREQHAYLQKLEEAGYRAQFTVGFTQTTETIKTYLQGEI